MALIPDPNKSVIAQTNLDLDGNGGSTDKVDLNETGTTYKPTGLLDRIRFNRFSSGKKKLTGDRDFDDDGGGLGWTDEDKEQYGPQDTTSGVPPTIAPPNWAAGIQKAFAAVQDATATPGSKGLLGMGGMKY